MPEKFPVQEQVDDEQGYEGKTRNIMEEDPVIPGNPHPGDPAATPSPTGRKEQEQYQPGYQGQDERDETTDVGQCVNGYAFHENPHDTLERPG